MIRSKFQAHRLSPAAQKKIAGGYINPTISKTAEIIETLWDQCTKKDNILVCLCRIFKQCQG